VPHSVGTDPLQEVVRPSGASFAIQNGIIAHRHNSVRGKQLGTPYLLQDRWFELSGSEGAAVRLRLTVVPGALARTRSKTTSSSSRWPHSHSQPGDDNAVTQTLAFFHKQLQRSSRDSILVEVRGAGIGTVSQQYSSLVVLIVVCTSTSTESRAALQQDMLVAWQADSLEHSACLYPYAL
jgi:hypothetical protein